MKRKKLAVDSVFNKFDDEEADELPRKRKLVPLDYGEDEKGGLGLDGAEVAGTKGSVNTEEKRKHIKSLIEKIPTAKPELFSYPLDWAIVDSVRCFGNRGSGERGCVLCRKTMTYLWDDFLGQIAFRM